MTRHQRSSDGPMPYGPSGQPTPPADGSAPPSQVEPPVTPPPTPPAWNPPGGDVPPPMAPSDPGLPPPPPPVGQASGFGGHPGFGAPPPVAQWAPPPGAYSTSVPGAPGLQYARTLDRVMAWLLDSFLLAIPSLILSVIILGGAGAGSIARLDGPALVANVITIGINILYFVGFWTGHARATLGMRLMKLQLGDAETGANATVQQGIIRWFVLGGVISIAASIPGLTGLVSFAALVWELVLLATTATSPTKQGLHDRIARTAMVQPANAQTPAQACLIILIALFAIWVVGVIALVALGGEVSRILSTVGTSI